MMLCESACGLISTPLDDQLKLLGSPPPVVDEPSVHCWLEPPLQVHSSTSAPLAVLAPVTSRHSPDCTPVMVPLELMFHCWLAPPLQVQISTLVPGVVWLPEASRHIWLLPL